MARIINVNLIAGFLFLSMLLGGTVFSAEPPPPYTSRELLEACASRQLWKDSYWDLLLHRRRGVSGVRGLIDDPDFYLSPSGKRDARAELEATVTALVSPPQEGREHAFDRFPARCEWLVEQLQLERARLPVPRCEEVDKIIASIEPQAAVFIFPNAYMNSPASMFGHTLLAIRGADPELLNQAINYSAFSRETNGLLFAFKGVFGLYDGFFNVTPYYQKIQEYNDINMRDIWEYELNLTRPEIERMMRHVWELHEISSRYFFFDENCSYNMMILLDVARPGANLYRRTRPWVVPLDTLKLIQRAGLVEQIRYRPSRATQLAALDKSLDKRSRRLALALADGTMTAREASQALGSPAEEAKVLDMATTYLQTRRAKKELDKQTYAKRFLHCLSARSRLAAESAPGEPSIPLPSPPDLGHSSLRLATSRGRDAGEHYTNLNLRAAYHDAMDPEPGYLNGAEVEFGNLNLRVADGGDQIEFARLDLLAIRSLAPRDAFFKPTSWEINVSAAKDWVGEDERRFYSELGLGGGRTWRLADAGHLYVMPRTELRVGDFDHAHALGAGFTAGLWFEAASRLQLGASVRAIQFFSGDCYEDLAASLHAGIRITRNTSIVGTLRARTVDRQSRDLAAVELRVYF